MNRLLIYVLTFCVGLSWILTDTSTLQAQQVKKITLAGYKHNPPVSTSGSGSVTITLKGDTLSLKGTFEDLVDIYFGGYIMVSIRGERGNQLHRLKATLDEDNRTSGTFAKEENKFALSEAEKELLAKGDLYINITSRENRKGELRGNIGPMKD